MVCGVCCGVIRVFFRGALNVLVLGFSVHTMQGGLVYRKDHLALHGFALENRKLPHRKVT